MSVSDATAARFPLDADDLTPEILTRAIAAHHPGVIVEDFDIASTKRCGEGIASTADRVVLDVRYADSTGAELPARLILKTMLATAHAPAVMFETEVRFYAQLRPEITIETPRVFGTSFDRASGQFGLLLEDLTARGARFPNATTHVGLDELRSLIDNLARLHAQYWRSPRFETDLAWVPTPTFAGMYDVFTKIGPDFIRAQLGTNEFKRDLIAPLGTSFDVLWDKLWRAQNIFAAETPTLLHGDPHIGNTYLLPNASGGLLDWQLLIRGCWAHDIAYIIATSLDSDDRRAHEAELLDFYLARLGESGVEAPPARAEAELQYRRAALWGLVIGWLITPPENYGPEITMANIERMVAAVQDLDTLEAIG